MFLATPEDNVVAVEAATGKKLWEWEANVAEDEQKSEFVDGIQGLSLGEGKVFVETTGAQLVALNAKSGKEIWQQLVALQDTKLESPAVPSYYNGVVYVGVSGAETARGHVNAYEASDGKLHLADLHGLRAGRNAAGQVHRNARHARLQQRRRRQRLDLSGARPQERAAVRDDLEPVGG